MESENKTILDKVTITDIGKTEKKTVRVLWNILTETSILANGKMVKKMDKVHIYSMQQGWSSSEPLEQDKLSMENGCIQMVHFSKVISKIIFRKV